MIRLLALRELRSLFSMPSTWFVLAALQFIFAWFFLARLEAFLDIQPQLAQLANPPGVTSMVAAPMFNTVALLLMMLVPLFTMRLIAEERRNQTLALLLSSPLSTPQIVLGKFLGLLVFLAVLMVSVPLMIYTLSLGTSLDNGLLLSNMLGLFLLTGDRRGRLVCGADRLVAGRHRCGSAGFTLAFHFAASSLPQFQRRAAR